MTGIAKKAILICGNPSSDKSATACILLDLLAA